MKSVHSYMLTLRSTDVVTLTVTADDEVFVYDNGQIVLSNNDWWSPQTVTYNSDPCVLAVSAVDGGVLAGILGETSTGVMTDASWKCSMTLQTGWHLTSFDDSGWSNAVITGTNGDGNPWQRSISGISTQAKWIWADVTPYVGTTYCRKTLC